MGFLGIPYMDLNFASFFLLLGIGIDNTFLMINAWHKTDESKAINERLGETMSEAGVSILITCLTDIICFFITCLAPFGFIKSFSTYTATGLSDIFLLQITFFPACLALRDIDLQKLPWIIILQTFRTNLKQNI